MKAQMSVITKSNKELFNVFNSKMYIPTITGAKHDPQLGMDPHHASSSPSADLVRNEFHPGGDISMDSDNESSAS